MSKMTTLVGPPRDSGMLDKIRASVTAVATSPSASTCKKRQSHSPFNPMQPLLIYKASREEASYENQDSQNTEASHSEQRTLSAVPVGKYGSTRVKEPTNMRGSW